MQPALQVRVYRKRELCFSADLGGSIELGRQRPGEPEPFVLTADSRRLIIAPLEEKVVSRAHLSITVSSSTDDDDGAKIEIRNLSKKRSVTIDSHGKLGPEQVCEAQVPSLISFEDFAIRVQQEAKNWESHSLLLPTRAPGAVSGEELSRLAQQSILAASGHDSYQPEQLIRWFTEMLGVLQSATGSSNFLAEAVDAVDRIVGLDSIAAVRLERGEWTVAFRRDRQELETGARSPSTTILHEVAAKKHTIFHVPSQSTAVASLAGVQALVASPILDESGEVIGAIYGARYSSRQLQVPQISELEATMVEVIACSAAAGIAREHQQQKAIQARVQFEQFFTPQLARELESNPRMLDGQDADISVLFCDIVGFSSVSNRIGSRTTMQWIGDVMDILSEAVLNHDGVVVDYIGDELMAMWGAPKADTDHAHHACQAALAMMNCRESIDRLWEKRTEQSTQFRIGINSGIASVGNTGSNRRLKYGPLGNTVNLASRLQSAAKQFGVQVLVSQSTLAKATFRDSFSVEACDTQHFFRPLGTASFVNIPQPVCVHELCLGDDTASQAKVEAFSRSIELVNQGDLVAAKAVIEALRDRFADDRASQLFLGRLGSPDLDPNCIWPLDRK